MIRLKTKRLPEKQEMREAYCQALIECAEKNERIIVLDCDLSNSVGTKPFYERFPERAFNAGIMEANTIGVAAGLSVTGFIPLFHSFSVFSSRRVCDQVFQSCVYAGLNVKIMGCDAGISAAFNGGTHMAFEDIGVLRSIPEITITEPTDTTMMKRIFPMLIGHYGTDYLRMPRKTVTGIYDESSEFEWGKAVVLREGRDATIIAGGMMVSEALSAAELLEGEGIFCRVVDMFTIKPLDTGCVEESARLTGAVVTAENHNIIGGLGSAVGEVLGETFPVPLERVGVRDTFGDVGSESFLRARYGLRSEDIVKAVNRVLKRKGEGSQCLG